MMLYEELRTKYLIQPEMASKEYVLCMTSVCDTKEGFERFIKAILAIEEDIEKGRFRELSVNEKSSEDSLVEQEDTKHENTNLEKLNQTFLDIEFLESEIKELQKPKRYYESYELDGFKEEVIPLIKSEGRVVLDYIHLYPPGIPLLVPGEVITRPMIEKLLRFKQAFLKVKGLVEEEGDFIRVKAGEKHV